MAEGDPLDIVDIRVTEDGVGDWKIDHIVNESERKNIVLPISVARAAEFWIFAASPQALNAKVTSIGPITLRFRDHKQVEGEAHQYRIEEPPIGPPKSE